MEEKREGKLYKKLVTQIDFSGNEYNRKVLDEARAEIFEAIGDFEFHEPYNYNIPQLKIKYEIAAKKLLTVASKLIKWFGDGGAEEKTNHG